MRRNMGTTDRVLRILVVAIIAVLYLINALSVTLAAILGVMAIVSLATSFIGFCPLYGVLKVSTGIPQPEKKEGIAS